MSTHFKWYPGNEETIIPWNARYSFPTESNKAEKMTPRIPPKSGGDFAPGQVIRLEFPAQGYVNPLNTTLEFDVTLTPGVLSGGAKQQTRFQNNIQCLFSRVRLLYGSTPLEDIPAYNHIVRSLTEWSATNKHLQMDQTAISEGIGGIVVDCDTQPGALTKFGLVNVRQKYIQGYTDCSAADGGTPANFTGGAGWGYTGNGNTPPGGRRGVTRRYQVNLALGLLTQDKLIPTKFMASQLAIEITLANPKDCIITGFAANTGAINFVSGQEPTYSVNQVNLIPEIMQFDSSYDAMFLKGLREDGVPIKFSSWHQYTFNSAGSSNMSFAIQERSRSVKAIFAMQRRSQTGFQVDSGATFFDTSGATVDSSLQQYQYRIGGRYFPAAPVQCADTVGGSRPNGGCEAYLELQKALNIVGDYRLSTSANPTNWAITSDDEGVMNEYDYNNSIAEFDDSNGKPVYVQNTSATNCFAGSCSSGVFCMPINLETSNGLEISGLNAEEQSDISLLINYTREQTMGAGSGTSLFEVFVYYDALLILRENNVLELVQ
jgi:hypothetical protein